MSNPGNRAIDALVSTQRSPSATTGVRERTTPDVVYLRERKASCQLRRVQLTHEYENAIRDVNASEARIDRELAEQERETRDTEPCSAPWSDDQAPSWSVAEAAARGEEGA